MRKRKCPECMGVGLITVTTIKFEIQEGCWRCNGSGWYKKIKSQPKEKA